MNQETKSREQERRQRSRHRIKVDVNFRHDENYLFAHATNMSELGIFLAADELIAKGTQLDLSFRSPDSDEIIQVAGEVVWVETGQAGRTPGMGIRFITPTEPVKKQIKALIRTIAYLETPE